LLIDLGNDFEAAWKEERAALVHCTDDEAGRAVDAKRAKSPPPASGPVNSGSTTGVHHQAGEPRGRGVVGAHAAADGQDAAGRPERRVDVSDGVASGRRVGQGRRRGAALMRRRCVLGLVWRALLALARVAGEAAEAMVEDDAEG